MKFVTFNIRCDFGQDGANNFIYRRPLILEKSDRKSRISSVFRRYCRMWPPG